MTIPSYPDSRPLELADKLLFDKVFQQLQPRISEFCFAGLYLFRGPHSYRLSLASDSLVLLAKGYYGEEYFMPPLTGDRKRAIHRLLDENLILYGADETCLTEFDLYRADIAIEEDRDNFDYLYLRDQLVQLPGNLYHKKKNRINYFMARHPFRVELFSPQYLEGSMRLLEEWNRVRSNYVTPSLLQESAAAAESLQLADSLGLQGVVVLVNNEVKGFSLGERLNGTTSVCHFEKVDPFMEGLSQLIDREFNRLLFTDCIWANREQDLGVPGLRAAKLSYHPAELVKKYRLRKIRQ
jgi:hypothetical protein